jgi:hypothetical protein
VALASQGKIRHTIKNVSVEQVNGNLNLLRGAISSGR